jgi:hypothetical protein
MLARGRAVKENNITVTDVKNFRTCMGLLKRQFKNTVLNISTADLNAAARSKKIHMYNS